MAKKIGRVMLLAASLCFSIVASAGDREKTLYSFMGGDDGSTPWAGVTFDAHGNLFGATRLGGSAGCGTVFELTPQGSGKWSETVIWTFAVTPNDGCMPYDNLALDASGNVYGTASAGGIYGGGRVFELVPTGSGWTQNALYDFGAYSGDGTMPTSSLTFDSAGDLYGTTNYGGNKCGNAECGVVYKLTPGNGKWTESVPYRFNGGNDGGRPWGGVILDSSGNIYGTTSQDGRYGLGTVFKLAPGRRLTTLHAFTGGSDAGEPFGNLTFDSRGNLYGTTAQNDGDVFELVRTSRGYTERILHGFRGGADGAQPYGGVVFDTAGHLYGTTSGGGAKNAGTMFKLSKSGGHWNKTTLYSFQGGGDGSEPGGDLAVDSSGNLYGMCQDGGGQNDGTVFEVTP